MTQVHPADRRPAARWVCRAGFNSALASHRPRAAETSAQAAAAVQQRFLLRKSSVWVQIFK
jgi:hypothetical protein